MEYEVWIEKQLSHNETFDTISSIWDTRAEAQIQVDKLKMNGVRAWIEVDQDSLFDEDFDSDDAFSSWDSVWKDLP